MKKKKILKIGGRFSTNERKTCVGNFFKPYHFALKPVRAKKIWLLKDKVVDFLPMRGRHMGDEKFKIHFKCTSIGSVYVGL